MPQARPKESGRLIPGAISFAREKVTEAFRQRRRSQSTGREHHFFVDARIDQTSLFWRRSRLARTRITFSANIGRDRRGP
jgi:hypothetical protein